MSYHLYAELFSQRCFASPGRAVYRREPSSSMAQIACEGPACSLPTSSAQLPVDVDAFLDGSSGAPPAQVVQMAGGRVISRQGRNRSYLTWQGGKDEGGATAGMQRGT